MSTKKTMPIKSKIPSLWQLLIHLKAKMMTIMTGAWKDSKPGRSTRRADKKADLKSLVEDFYIMDPGLFLKAAIKLFNELSIPGQFCSEIRYFYVFGFVKKY